MRPAPTTTAENGVTTRPVPTTVGRSCFAPPKMSQEIVKHQIDSVPMKTKARHSILPYTMKELESEPTKLHLQNNLATKEYDSRGTDTWLSRFVVEVRKTDGKVYPPNTLHYIVTGLQQYLHYEGKMVDLFKGLKCSPFWASLDGEMKRLQAKGVGRKKCIYC